MDDTRFCAGPFDSSNKSGLIVYIIQKLYNIATPPHISQQVMLTSPQKRWILVFTKDDIKILKLHISCKNWHIVSEFKTDECLLAAYNANLELVGQIQNNYQKQFFCNHLS